MFQVSRPAQHSQERPPDAASRGQRGLMPRPRPTSSAAQGALSTLPCQLRAPHPSRPPLTTGPRRPLLSSHSWRQAGMQVALSFSRISRSSGRSSILCRPRGVSLLSVSGLQRAGRAGSQAGRGRPGPTRHAASARRARRAGEGGLRPRSHGPHSASSPRGQSRRAAENGHLTPLNRQVLSGVGGSHWTQKRRTAGRPSTPRRRS